MPLAVDLLYPDPQKERQNHKLKRLVQHPNSYFMDVKCQGKFLFTIFLNFNLGCFRITTVFSHAQTVIFLVNLTYHKNLLNKFNLFLYYNLFRLLYA